MARRGKPDTSMEDELKRQAANHGLGDYDPDVSQSRLNEERRRQEEVELSHFSGLRHQTPSGNVFEPGKAPAVPSKLIMDYTSAEELEELGLEALKAELQQRGLKCGGTLSDRAKRLWQVRKMTDMTKVDPVLLAKPKRELEGAEKGEKKRQKGPLLPGQKMIKGQKKLPSSKVGVTWPEDYEY